MPKAYFISEKEYIDGDYCLISYESFKKEQCEKNEIVKLKCGHTFLYNNILESYKITNISGRNYIGKRICPYCRKSGGYLPYTGNEAIRGIHNLNAVKHWRLKQIENKKKTSGYNTCCAILVSGIHRGYPCGSLVKNNKSPYIYYCDININKHEDISEVKFTEVNWCGRHKKTKQKFINSNFDVNFIKKNYKLVKSDYVNIFDLEFNNKSYKVYLPYNKFFNESNKIDLEIGSLSIDSLKEKFKTHLKI